MCSPKRIATAATCELLASFVLGLGFEAAGAGRVLLFPHPHSVWIKLGESKRSRLLAPIIALLLLLLARFFLVVAAKTIVSVLTER